MNVIYLHSHDTGRQISPYGANTFTPHLQALAERGIVFRQAFSAAPTCSPSRAALLTGLTPHTAGMLGLAHRGFQLADYTTHLAHYLKSFGYDTILSGVQHEAFNATNLGYRRILGQLLASKRTESAERDDLANAEMVAQFIRSCPKKPYFLSFGMFNTHRPFPSSRMKEGYLIPPSLLPNVPEVRKDYGAFLTAVQIMDQCVGIVMDALYNTEQDNETLVLYTTDHGPPFPRMKCSLDDSGIGVSLIFKMPESTGCATGLVTDALVSHMDVFPTICDVLGIPRPSWLQGQSLFLLSRGETNFVHDAVFAESNYHVAYEPMRCVRTARYKLIRRFSLRVPLCNVDDGMTKDFLFDHGGIDAFQGMSDELYDLYLDPLEMRNLAYSTKYAAVRQDLNMRLRNWMITTHDPLLQGAVPKPAGATVNTVTCYSPDEKIFE